MKILQTKFTIVKSTLVNFVFHQIWLLSKLVIGSGQGAVEGRPKVKLEQGILSSAKVSNYNKGKGKVG
jgi:hypothetical protein